MEILIASDSHGRESNIRKLLQSHPNAAMLLFCGDGLRDLAQLEEEFPGIAFFAVRGNCDLLMADDTPTERLLTVGTFRILMMHGHLFGVKGGLGSAISYAKKQQADILLFGHTHEPYEENLSFESQKLSVFNPGSIGKRDCGAFFYGVLEIRNNGFLLSHGSFQNV